MRGLDLYSLVYGLLARSFEYGTEKAENFLSTGPTVKCSRTTSAVASGHLACCIFPYEVHKCRYQATSQNEGNKFR
jgi:hypothetical protein